MKSILQSFLLLLATATDRELARQIQFLKAENQILRSKLPKRITVTLQERQRLLKFGKAVGVAIKELISIVSPRTFARWLSGETKASAGKATKPGRPKTAEEVRELVLKLVRENAWGYTRILGELKKLGVRRIARSTVIKILKENGLDPGPKRGEGTWDDFLKRHASTLWACDFFSKKVWTLGGLVDVFALFFIHLGSRRVHIAGLTVHPDRQWMMQQARNVSMYFAEQPVKPTILLRDRDGKFVPEFDGILKSEGIDVKPIAPRSPNLNAIAERWVQSARVECLDHFVVFGEAHLRYILSEYVTYYHACRPHQSLDNLPLSGAPPDPWDHVVLEDIVCEERLGGLLKHYSRRRAG